MVYCYGNRCEIKESCKRYTEGLGIDPLVKTYWYHKPKRKQVFKKEDCCTFKKLDNKFIVFLKSIFN